MTGRSQHFALTQTIADSLSEPGDVERTLRRITQTARDTVPGVDYASICVRHRRRGLETVAETNPLLRKADAAQHALEEGPAYADLAAEGVVYSRDLAADARWPRYGAAVADLGVLSQLTIEIAHPTETDATLNLYARTRDAFPDSQALGELFSSQARIALRYAQKLHALTAAIEAGTTLGRATGVVMERRRLDGKAALSYIETLALRTNVTVQAAAESLLVAVPPKSTGTDVSGRRTPRSAPAR